MSKEATQALEQSKETVDQTAQNEIISLAAELGLDGKPYLEILNLLGLEQFAVIKKQMKIDSKIK